MRRQFLLTGLVAASFLAAGLIWHVTHLGAVPIGNDPIKPPPSPLAIKQVVLFNSGVGYIQREGEVEGNTRVDLTFPAADVNDLLKSLILQDLGGGRVSSVNYDSHDPIDKILGSFALDLTNNPTFGQLLNQARGEKIEVLRLDRKDQPPVKIIGTIVGMESQRQPIGKERFAEVDYLNLSGPNGLQSILLEQVLGVRFLNPTLESEFQRALKVLAGAHDVQKKTVSVGFNGVGKRPVKVGYVVERPIWKTTYRLRLEPNGKLFLQGWAIVENTSDDDWNDVRMVLVSGRPISYQMNLYEPLYIPRPLVEPELFASLRPPVYGGSVPGAFSQTPGGGGMPPAPIAEGGPADIGPPQGMGMTPPGLGTNPYQNLQGMNPYAAMNPLTGMVNKLTFEELQQRRQEQQKTKDPSFA